MECSRRWTFIAIVISVSYIDIVICQNVIPANGGVRENRECSKLPPLSSSTEMFNSLLSVAASNGVLPEMIPVLQGQPIGDNMQRFPYSPDILTKPLSVVPMPTPGMPQEPIIFSSQPIRQTTLNQNVLLATPCGPGCPPGTVPNIPQTISPPVLTPSNCISQITHVFPLENYPICAPNVGAVRPTPIVLQPQNQFNEVNPCNFYNQIAEPILLPEVNTNPLNFSILPPCQNLPPINTCSTTLEMTTNLGSSSLSQPPMLATDGQPLQINLPTASVPPPKVTVVSAAPSNSPLSIPVPCFPDYPVNYPPFPYPPPQPPLIIGGCSKSSWRNWLPLILVALLSDRGNNDGCGCCHCCCSCSGGSGNMIPIPFPIPIPVNNPIINSCPYPYSSRNRECRDDGDDDEDGKRV